MTNKLSATALILFTALWSMTSGVAATEKAEAADLVILSNPEMKIVIASASAKMVYLGKERNLLWLKNEEADAAQGGATGGSRLYPAQQKIWHSIWSKEWSSEDFDKMRWCVLERSENSVTLQTRDDSGMGIELERKFVLDDRKAVLHVTDHARRIEYSPFPVQLWTVTQFAYPAKCLLEVQKAVSPGRNFTVVGNMQFFDYKRIRDNSKSIEQELQKPQPGMKIGTLGSTITVILPDAILINRTEFFPNESYPDGASLEIYCDTTYFEAEVFSPCRYLKVGEVLKNTVSFEIRLPPETNEIVNRNIQ